MDNIFESGDILKKLQKENFGMGVCSDLGKVGEVSINSLQDMKTQMCMEYMNTSKT